MSRTISRSVVRILPSMPDKDAVEARQYIAFTSWNVGSLLDHIAATVAKPAVEIRIDPS